MKELFLDALIDSVRMVPFLFLIYGLVACLERKFGGIINTKLKKAANAGPAMGAVFGCLPQCGFSVLASALYVKRVITPGTLLAVYLATSDEAIPVILAQPDKAGFVLPLLLTKLVVALLGGYGVDLLLRNRKPSAVVLTEGLHNAGCCNHQIAGKISKRELFIHPLIHTAKIFVFVFIATLGLNLLIFAVGEENLGKALLQHTAFQPFLAALVGLIPNCAASVVIAEVFLKGGLSYGAMISGLCCSAGLGLLVLLKENRDTKDTLRIIFLLVAISTLTGLIIQAFYG